MGGLTVYYPENISNAIRAAEHSANDTAKALGNVDDPFTAAYLAGHQAALLALALAFGLVSGDNSRRPNPRRPVILAPG